MKATLIEVGDMGSFILPLPTSILDVMRWNEGDVVRFEVVVGRDGTASHIVLEKE